MALSSEQLNEIKFWTPQLKEHALFLELGLEPVPGVVEDPLLAPASLTPSIRLQVPKKIQELSAKHKNDVSRWKNEALASFQTFTAFEKDIANNKLDADKYFKEVVKLDQLKSEIIVAQDTGVWVGWLYPQFTFHVREELRYFLDRLNNSVSPTEEAKFWIGINADHAGFAARLMDVSRDKSHRKTVRSAFNLSEEGLDLEESEVDLHQMIRLSAGFAKRVDSAQVKLWDLQVVAGQGQNQDLSIIHPTLLAHVIRENRRSQQRLQTLGITIPLDQQRTLLDFDRAYS